MNIAERSLDGNRNLGEGIIHWDPTTNTHKKLHPEHGCMMKWDPDSSIAISVAKEKRRQELLNELSLL
jgi:hypothetical protein